MNKDITPFNKQGNRHGYWEVYYDDGMIMYKDYYFEGYKVSEEKFIELGGELSKEPSYLFY